MKQQNIKERGTTISMTQSASSIYEQPRHFTVTFSGVNLAIIAIILTFQVKNISADSNGISGSSIKLTFRHLIWLWQYESYFRVIFNLISHSVTPFQLNGMWFSFFNFTRLHHCSRQVNYSTRSPSYMSVIVSHSLKKLLVKRRQ